MTLYQVYVFYGLFAKAKRAHQVAVGAGWRRVRSARQAQRYHGLYLHDLWLPQSLTPFSPFHLLPWRGKGRPSILSQTSACSLWCWGSDMISISSLAHKHSNQEWEGSYLSSKPPQRKRLAPHNRDYSQYCCVSSKSDLTGQCPGPSLCLDGPRMSRTSVPGLPSIRSGRGLQAHGSAVPGSDSARALEGTVNMFTHHVHQRSELRQPPAGSLYHMEKKGIQTQQPFQRQNWSRERIVLCLYMEETMWPQTTISAHVPFPSSCCPSPEHDRLCSLLHLGQGLSEAADTATPHSKQHSWRTA